VRWLAEVFAPAKQVKFVLVVKDPIANAHFETPQKCVDTTAAACQGLSGPAPRFSPSKLCPESRALCSGSRANRLWARYRYALTWVEDHERVARDLRTWGWAPIAAAVGSNAESAAESAAGSAAGSSDGHQRPRVAAPADHLEGSASSRGSRRLFRGPGFGAASRAGLNGTRAVLVVRYEQFALGCTCESVLSFAFSAYGPSSSEGGEGEGGANGRRRAGPLLVPAAEITAACKRAPTCRSSGSSSGSGSSVDSSTRGGGSSKSGSSVGSTDGGATGSSDEVDEPSEEAGGDSGSAGRNRRSLQTARPRMETAPHSKSRRYRRRLGYEGSGGGGRTGKPATVHKDRSSAPRHVFWQQQLDLPKGWPEGCLAAFKVRRHFVPPTSFSGQEGGGGAWHVAGSCLFAAPPLSRRSSCFLSPSCGGRRSSRGRARWATRS
jgi:hypothetical protein